ncbi:MAG: type II toxin-antitoxin system VapC family toxin [Ardenticatenales bacterium]|nr:type II toxin-antitoxin system VapC family toxin [Ardenticatenales bacterium]
MNTSFVIDASVFIAAARAGEAFHADARSLLEILVENGASLYVPAIILPEMAAALARQEADPLDIVQQLGAVGDWPGANLVPVDEPLAKLSARLAADQRLRGCDAIYVALAHMVGADLISLDNEQRSRAPRSVPTLTPAEALERLAARP